MLHDSTGLMQRSTKVGNRKVPLLCPTRARLALQWRVAAEHQSGEVARAEQNLKYASLEQHANLVALSAELRRETEHAMEELRSHRATHGC